MTPTRYIDTLKERAINFRYDCPDGSSEILGPEGGQFKEITCPDPIVRPLFEGGPLKGRHLSELNK